MMWNVQIPKMPLSHPKDVTTQSNRVRRKVLKSFMLSTHLIVKGEPSDINGTGGFEDSRWNICAYPSTGDHDVRLVSWVERFTGTVVHQDIRGPDGGGRHTYILKWVILLPEAYYSIIMVDNFSFLFLEKGKCNFLNGNQFARLHVVWIIISIIRGMKSSVNRTWTWTQS